MKITKNSPKNPSSIKTQLAFRFLRSMTKLKNNNMLRNNSPAMADHKHKRYQAIRAAAYASMASVVGPNKAWSRAVLRRIKNRELQRALWMKDRKATHRRRARNPRSELGFGPENDLRGLVPGGKALGFGRLLSETSDYINCLIAQVEVMRKIVDYSSKLSV